jgi:LPXTG-motif cell wall-anchored protein
VKRILATVATATLALGGLVATATTAAAHTPDVKAECGSLAINLTAYNDREENTVTVVVDGDTVLDESFGRSFSKKLELTKDEAHEWSVVVDAWDGYDKEFTGGLEACVEAPRKVETAFYVYPKLNPEKPAAWENSGKQTLVTTREGGEFWDELPTEYPGELFDVESLPADVCEGSWGVQQDIVGIHPGFDWADYVHITYPGGPLFQDLRDHRHDDLSNYLPECGEDAVEEVTLPTPSFVESCDAEDTVTLPQTELASYTEQWTEDRSQVTVTAVPAEGVRLAPEAVRSWTFEFTGEICETAPVTVVPSAPVVVDECGTENDSLTLPTATDQIAYSSTAEGIVATAATDYTLGELPAGYTSIDANNALYTVDETVFTDEPCETTPTEEPSDEPSQEPVVETDDDRTGAQDVAVDTEVEDVEGEQVAAQTTELPRTGATVGITAGVAALLVAAGAVLFVMRRRVSER